MCFNLLLLCVYFWSSNQHVANVHEKIYLPFVTIINDLRRDHITILSLDLFRIQGFMSSSSQISGMHLLRLKCHVLTLLTNSSCSSRYLNCIEFFILLNLYENTKFKTTSDFLFFCINHTGIRAYRYQYQCKRYFLPTMR